MGSGPAHCRKCASGYTFAGCVFFWVVFGQKRMFVFHHHAFILYAWTAADWWGSDGIVLMLFCCDCAKGFSRICLYYGQYNLLICQFKESVFINKKKNPSFIFEALLMKYSLSTQTFVQIKWQFSLYLQLLSVLRFYFAVQRTHF